VLDTTFVLRAMEPKRRRPQQLEELSSLPPAKRARLPSSQHLQHLPPSADRLSLLSDELILRILAYLPFLTLLSIAPTSRRFHRMASDPHLWHDLYYERFVLRRTMRIPRSRHSHTSGGASTYSLSRRVPQAAGWTKPKGRLRNIESQSADWKRQYKIRHNWARGKCAVEELHVGEAPVQENGRSEKTLVKIIEGFAVTADVVSGLRAWDLKTRQLLAQISLVDDGFQTTPTCIALDGESITLNRLDISLGFVDGSFGVWRLDLEDKRLVGRYRHKKSTNGGLVGIAYSHPYILTATQSVLISLYTFSAPIANSQHRSEADGDMGLEVESETDVGSESATLQESDSEMDERLRRVLRNTKKNQAGAREHNQIALSPPYLLTSLKSHTSHPPLAVSIRKMATSVIASIAYTFSTLEGWSIGIQDLHIRSLYGASGRAVTTPEVIASRIAYTSPITCGPLSSNPLSFDGDGSLSSSSELSPGRSINSSVTESQFLVPNDGPIALCYTHPYLLATLPDNTLVLYLCTSNATSLSVSSGIRLWGHTSGIGDADITARGKAVSVSFRGDEIRVWELEGRVGGSSVEVKPTSGIFEQPTSTQRSHPQSTAATEWEDRRNWVGFDDEMVIVLKESKEGKESLMVYDFT
jgi:hypothetical protein